jgi:hypothetical protein
VAQWEGVYWGTVWIEPSTPRGACCIVLEQRVLHMGLGGDVWRGVVDRRRCCVAWQVVILAYIGCKVQVRLQLRVPAEWVPDHWSIWPP